MEFNTHSNIDNNKKNSSYASLFLCVCARGASDYSEYTIFSIQMDDWRCNTIMYRFNFETHLNGNFRFYIETNTYAFAVAHGL